jgi:hypothetical protein
MHTSNDVPGPARARRLPTWVWVLAGLLLVGCCAWSGLGASVFGPLTPWLANRLTSVQGKAELIAPAQWRPGGTLSPDGRYMVAGWNKTGQHERVVWDLVTGQQYPLALRSSALCWLNVEQFASLDSASNTYYLVQAHNMSIIQATQVIPSKEYPDPDGMARLQARWQSAEHVYVLHNFLYAGSTILTLERGLPYVYFDPKGTQDLDTLISNITYIHIPAYCGSASERYPLYSPDGQHYLQLSTGENARVQIYNRDGLMVAEAFKNGWDPRVMGWAHDSSGVYFQMLISGGAAGMLVPYQPIFKLSPLTEEEARWAPVWAVGPWVLGLAVVAGAGWWWWRRRQKAKGKR